MTNRAIMDKRITLLLPLPPKELSPNARGLWDRIEATREYRDTVYYDALRQLGPRAEYWRCSIIGKRLRLTETYRIAGKRQHDIRNLFAAFKAGEDALGPVRYWRGTPILGTGLLIGDDDSVLEHGPPRIERVKTKAEEGVRVIIEEIG